MKKQLLVAAAVIAGTAGLGLGGYSVAQADTTSAKTASSTVKHRTRHIRIEARLNQAVRDGTITSSQETAIKAELKTLKQERKSAITKSSTTAERQAERAKLKTELESWATSNNFPLSKIFPKA